MMTSRKVLLAARKRLRRMAQDVYHTRLHNNGPPQAVLFVLGCQRSGTTALLAALEQDWNVRVFGEFSELNVDPALRPKLATGPKSTLRLRPLDEVAVQVQRTCYPLVVCKPIVESHRAPELLEKFETARCLWVFRHYRDVADSIVRKWPENAHVRNLEPIVRGVAGNWRSEFVPNDVRALITRHYSSEMDPYDGGALFWYARNRLLLDLELIGRSRLMLFQYEDFASKPAAAFERVYEFVGAPYPGPKIVRSIKKTTVGRSSGIRFNEEVEACCEKLWEELLRAYHKGIPDQEGRL